MFVRYQEATLYVWKHREHALIPMPSCSVRYYVGVPKDVHKSGNMSIAEPWPDIQQKITSTDSDPYSLMTLLIKSEMQYWPLKAGETKRHTPTAGRRGCYSFLIYFNGTFRVCSVYHILLTFFLKKKRNNEIYPSLDHIYLTWERFWSWHRNTKLPGTFSNSFNSESTANTRFILSHICYNATFKADICLIFSMKSFFMMGKKSNDLCLVRSKHLAANNLSTT